METVFHALSFGSTLIKVDDDMLQEEFNRISQSTKAPERLPELLKSLDNDPVSISECLARPTLVRKYLYNQHIRGWRRKLTRKQMYALVISRIEWV